MVQSLEIDVGNSYLKWRFAGGDVVRAPRTESLEKAFSGLMLKQKPSDVWISSVAAEDFNHRLFCFCRNRFGVSAKFAAVQDGLLGVTLAYDEPKKLGVDRWLAMLGAKAGGAVGSYMVVDVGTAITVDVLEDGCHKGGLIVPGVDLLSRSLVENTSGIDLNQVSLAENWRLGKTTLDCVQSGLGLMLAGFFEQLVSANKVFDAVEQVFWCGGGAQAVVDAQDLPGLVCPDLVLDGLRSVFLGAHVHD